MQRSHINLVLKNNKKNKRGEVPIYLRITINRNSVFTSTGHYIQPKLWDSKSQMVKEIHPLHEQINLDITNRKREALDNVVHAGINKNMVTAKGVKGSIDGEATNLFLFCEKIKKELGTKREGGTYDNWDRHIRKIKEHTGDTLHFEQITPDFLHGLELYLRKPKVVKVRDGKDLGSYIAAIMRTIRRLFNEAIGKKLISADRYPFKRTATDGGYEIPKQETGGKEHLSMGELSQWEAFIIKGEKSHLIPTAVHFLFGCYTGLRVSDWYQFKHSQVHGSYISLRVVKNKSWVAIPVHTRLKNVLQLMKQYPLSVEKGRLNEQIKEIAEEVGINKHLSTHCARKTFAVTMCLEMGISSETAAELMGITLKVFVESYAAVTPEKIRKETAVWNGL